MCPLISSQAKGQYLPASACLALSLCGRVSGLWWDHFPMFLLLEGTPCCYASITQTLHMISGGNGREECSYGQSSTVRTLNAQSSDATSTLKQQENKMHVQGQKQSFPFAFPDAKVMSKQPKRCTQSAQSASAWTTVVSVYHYPTSFWLWPCDSCWAVSQPLCFCSLCCIVGTRLLLLLVFHLTEQVESAPVGQRHQSFLLSVQLKLISAWDKKRKK